MNFMENLRFLWSEVTLLVILPLSQAPEITVQLLVRLNYRWKEVS